jgi:hypothetical protein
VTPALVRPTTGTPSWLRIRDCGRPCRRNDAYSGIILIGMPVMRSLVKIERQGSDAASIHSFLRAVALTSESE